MWTKYDYVCTDCDALIEITTLEKIDDWRGWCSCGSANIINIGSYDANILKDRVTNVTYTEVVRINTNPYTL